MDNKQETNNVIVIDLDVWTTQKEKARTEGLTPEAINHRISRGKIEYWHIEELNLKLVKK